MDILAEKMVLTSLFESNLTARSSAHLDYTTGGVWRCVVVYIGVHDCDCYRHPLGGILSLEQLHVLEQGTRA